MDVAGSNLSGAHGQDDGGCAGGYIPPRKNTGFGSFSGFRIGDNISPFACFNIRGGVGDQGIGTVPYGDHGHIDGHA